MTGKKITARTIRQNINYQKVTLKGTFIFLFTCACASLVGSNTHTLLYMYLAAYGFPILFSVIVLMISMSAVYQHHLWSFFKTCLPRY